MKYWVIGGAIVGWLLGESGNHLVGMIIGVIVSAAIRRWLFRKFWM